MTKKFYQQFGCSKMMLPEHRHQLQEQEKKKQQEGHAFPLIDEQQLELWDRMLSFSLQQKVPLKITYLLKGKSCTAEGIVSKKRSRPPVILLSTREGLLEIPAGKITGMDFENPSR